MEPHNFLIAIDSFKGSLTSQEAIHAAAQGVRDVYPEAKITLLPVADGGEGTIEAVMAATDARLIQCKIHDPSYRLITSSYIVIGDLVIIEMAKAAGLTLLSPEERDPMHATTSGVGELIINALDRGYRRFIIGVGGSATNDTGIGMLRALGYRFYDSDNKEIGPVITDLSNLEHIDTSSIHPALKESEFILASDVGNPLCGPHGATAVFGPQKGVTADKAPLIEYALKHFSDICTKQLCHDYSNVPGAGSGGGIGFAFLAFLNARIRSGIDTILDLTGFDEKLKDTDIVITGEGCLDAQTLMGKAPLGILRRTLKHNIPVIAVGGSVESYAVPSLLESGFTGIYRSTPDGMPLSDAMRPDTARQNLRATIAKHLRISNI